MLISILAFLRFVASLGLAVWRELRNPANPEFRQGFLARLRGLCQSTFTEPELFPVINALEQRLEPEMQGPEALAEFRRHIQSFRDQVTHRRKFILSELDKP